MATISITNELDVATKYDILVRQSLAGDSVYIRAKETLEELFDNGTITEAEKSSIISNIIGGIVSTITTSSMSTAIAWAQSEKDIALKKLELEKQLDILSQEILSKTQDVLLKEEQVTLLGKDGLIKDQDVLLKAAQVDQVSTSVRLAKVESKRMYGAGTFDIDGNLTFLQDEGKIYSDIAVNTAQINKISEENLLVQQKVKESYAAVHKIVADTYVNYGSYTYSDLTDTGVTSVTPHHGTFTTLSNTQQDIAIEQAKGYVYNAWANALTGSASMLGTAIASGYSTFAAGSTGGDLLDVVLATAQNLKAASTTVNEAQP